jgi:hypothetical protein
MAADLRYGPLVNLTDLAFMLTVAVVPVTPLAQPPPMTMNFWVWAG